MLRDHPFVWITWLKGLMAGDDSCEWQIWYKVHNQDYPKMPQDFDSVAWNLAHTLLLRKTRIKWETKGPDVVNYFWRLTTENQNSFKMDWPVDGSEIEAVISGKPDLIAHSGDGSLAVIIDAKTGKPRTSDRVQVLLYMYLYQLATNDPAQFSGVIQYENRADEIPNSMLSQVFKDTADYWMAVALADDPPIAVPSQNECVWCDIADCKVRFIK